MGDNRVREILFLIQKHTASGAALALESGFVAQLQHFAQSDVQPPSELDILRFADSLQHGVYHPQQHVLVVGFHRLGCANVALKHFEDAPEGLDRQALEDVVDEGQNDREFEFANGDCVEDSFEQAADVEHYEFVLFPFGLLPADPNELLESRPEDLGGISAEGFPLFLGVEVEVVDVLGEDGLELALVVLDGVED